MAAGKRRARRNWMPLDDFHVAPRSDDEIERIASALRIALDSGDEWARAYCTLLEKAGCAKARIMHRNSTANFISPINSAERQASLLAAAFLMPLGFIRPCAL